MRCWGEDPTGLWTIQITDHGIPAIHSNKILVFLFSVYSKTELVECKSLFVIIFSCICIEKCYVSYMHTVSLKLVYIYLMILTSRWFFLWHWLCSVLEIKTPWHLDNQKPICRKKEVNIIALPVLGFFRSKLHMHMCMYCNEILKSIFTSFHIFNFLV